MTEPKLFLDGRLLAALLVELEDELGYDRAARTLFQIGLMHGLRDADRAVARGLLSTAPHDAGSGGRMFPALEMEIAAPSGAGAGWCVTGRWPERHEAGAWLAKLGPADAPTCWLSCGYTSGWLSGTLDANVIAVEHACAGCGEGECAFVAREVDAWEQAASAAAASPATLAFLDIVSGIDLDVYRALALRSPSGPRPDMIESEGEFEPDAPLVHIWGPVMIMPFTNADELLRTTEALSRDVGIREIRAVVIDLRDRMIDEAFDAAAIERAIETVEAWSAEPILTGVAPLAEPVVAGLEAGHLIVRKDLSEAIAAAFLIAEVQRHAA
ncbi:MAG: V4R domain-containing protein [Myxococcota bacterium]|nr:hypothetical protein [Myxococcales bacterium]